ncbi:putative multidrug resistance protein fnx1 [Trematosphaeria pertusa]|uniref:Putative multidrug resistance protein fnx1 n=1 Tax=Trematosphaeria pertusa TaxID=390896 RepID=A0A6A6IN65_9PLEO|nr:putative multidrug resistance protein fnx1 [Trematosphaeria pertusa]KAF2251689.1 putative multidrug resistance protein fnx1 [Trematosphaeria pertusa]
MEQKASTPISGDIEASHEPGAPILRSSSDQIKEPIRSSQDASDFQDGENHVIYIVGVRFWLIIASLAMSLFLTNLEIPIVTTSLVAITNDFGRFDNVGWIISSYLLGYVGVLVIFAKLSDIFGRKLMLSLSISIFILFSAGCGASQSLTQLIILRAFQGVGGAGCFALASVMLTELVPPEKLAQYVANLSTVYAISLLCGPIIGGAISSRSTWRWVFLLNIPAAAPALIFAIFALPKNFPHHGQLDRPRRTFKTLIAKETTQKVDLMGAGLLLLATLSMTAGFEEADSQFPWKSAYVISLLTISGILWISLVLWERYITNHSKTVEPVLPWRFMQDRAMLSLLLNAVFLGGPWFVAIFQLPQKFQLVHGSSGLRAGIQTMPFTFAAPIGSAFSSMMASKLKIPAIFIVLVSGVLQTIGFALLASLPESSHIPPRTYGYQVIAGFGCGINISTLLLIVPFVVEYRDKAVGMAAVSQLRVMGGAIVLAIATSVFNSYTRPKLAQFLESGHLAGESIPSVQSLAQFSVQDQESIKGILAHGYNLQMWVLCAFAIAQIPSALLLWRKKQIMV